MPEKLAKTDRDYIKYKMRKIRKLKRQGNHGAARRNVAELMQYVDVGEGETPIEDVMEDTDIPRLRPLE